MAIAVRSCFYQNLSKHRKMTMVSIVFLDCFYIRFVVSVSSYGLIIFLLYHSK